MNFIKDHVRSQKFAWAGLKAVAKNELNFKLELIISLTVIIVSACFLSLNYVEFALVISACMAVLICETINTAIEALGDAISSKFNQHIKIAKDAGAAAVLLSAFYALFIAILVILPKILALF